MLQKIKAYIKKHHMIESKDQIVVGVSGGADSVCLLKILASLQEELDFGLRVVHVEHGIRGRKVFRMRALPCTCVKRWGFRVRWIRWM